MTVANDVYKQVDKLKKERGFKSMSEALRSLFKQEQNQNIMDIFIKDLEDLKQRIQSLEAFVSNRSDGSF